MGSCCQWPNEMLVAVSRGRLRGRREMSGSGLVTFVVTIIPDFEQWANVVQAKATRNLNGKLDLYTTC